LYTSELPTRWHYLQNPSAKIGQIVRFAAADEMAIDDYGGILPDCSGVYRGVRATGSLGIKDDLVNAGAVWEDAPVVIDRHFVSSRKPDDLPDFCRGILQVMPTGR